MPFLIPPKHLRVWVGPFEDKNIYLEGGKEQVEQIISWGKVEHHHTILDLGCGCGRMAIHFADFLSKEGNYVGLDNAKSLLDWCINNISPLFSNFKFHYIDAYSGSTNKQGKIPPVKVRFQFDDNNFDIVIANSLFTHMFLEDTSNYLSETFRVLKPGGVFIASYLLLNESALTSIERGEAFFNLIYQVDNYSRTLDEKVPEEGIAHDENQIINIYIEKGFAEYLIRHGNWRNKQLKISHDIIIASKQIHKF